MILPMRRSGYRSLLHKISTSDPVLQKSKNFIPHGRPLEFTVRHLPNEGLACACRQTSPLPQLTLSPFGRAPNVRIC